MTSRWLLLWSCGLTVVAGDVEVTLVEFTEAAELHVRLVPSVYLAGGVHGGGGRTHELLALVVRPLTTHPFRDAAPFLLPKRDTS